ncbi:DUF721 domain-containing protein [Pseudoalteromonas sp. R3]|jgi:hypothetical protein|uniref:DUF721 domain-containing protein n=1 Tax=Pseudoalteromonas sp. R3 TaxID=1709477 RepID=UPI0006B679E6|nr:DUF721 domain-containing protein [Pseudoalteromonas sp. R3]AZZ99604.1 DUF721 domain-containing protein [Pseudoalteromonas sp. R3]
MSKNRFDPKPLGELAGGWSDKLSGYMQKAQGITELQQPLQNALGPVLSKKCRVANYQEGTLYVEAASATLATRLNYLKMEILSSFRAAGYHDCCQVKIGTNPEAQQRLTKPQNQIKTPNSSYSGRQMSEQTAGDLMALAEHAPAGLKEKLLRLAKHGRQKK